MSSIRSQRLGSVHFGEAAIATHYASMVGGFAVAGGWAMHDPAIVYLSGKYLANRARLEDFKITAQEAAVAYGQRVLPRADEYMATLDFLLEIRDRDRYRDIIKKVIGLLAEGKVEEGYGIVESRSDITRRRG